MEYVSLKVCKSIGKSPRPENAISITVFTINLVILFSTCTLLATNITLPSHLLLTV